MYMLGNGRRATIGMVMQTRLRASLISRSWISREGAAPGEAARTFQGFPEESFGAGPIASAPPGFLSC